MKRRPALVDHDRVGQRALAVDEDAAQGVGLDGDHADGDPPRLTHVGEHRPRPHGHEQTVAGRRLDRDRVAHRSPQERAPELLVPLETTGGEHDALRCIHIDRAIGSVDDDTDDYVVLDDQLAAGARRPGLDAPGQAGVQEAPGQCLPAAPLVAELPPLVLFRRRRLGHRLAQRRLAHGDVGVGEVGGRRHAVGPIAELVEREDRALERPPSLGAAARELRVVVGHAGDGVELDGRLRLEQLDHLRPGVDVGLDEPGLEHVARQRHDVGDRLVPAVGHTDVGHVRVVRDPHLAAGPRGGAPDLVGLLEHGDAGPTFVGGHRRCEPGRSCAQHHDVEALHASNLLWRSACAR